MRRQRRLDSVGPSVRVAREFVRQILTSRHHPAGHIADVVLVVSELVTNSIRYGTEPGDSLLVVVVTDEHQTRIEVHDTVRRAPRLRPESDERRRGRGLYLVDALAAAWGTDERPKGKIVWAEVPR
ncbi:ATP-binding protein [Streptomyces sp. NPDC049555]|uniref:ATP-binding protein n=1 Tax=Streptomyces sp. NPDC049555 TaxID=3154930 RepID=UPI003431739D